MEILAHDADWPADQLWKPGTCEERETDGLAEDQPLALLLCLHRQNESLAVFIHAHIKIIDFNLTVSLDVSSYVRLEMKARKTSEDIEDPIISNHGQRPLFIAREVLGHDLRQRNQMLDGYT